MTLAEKYFAPKSFERWKNGRIYEYLGVRLFKRFLPTNGDLIASKYSERIIIGKKFDSAIKEFSGLSKIAEGIHTLCGLAMFLGHFRDYSKGDYGELLFGLSANILVNFYPTLVQRYNRTRAYALLDKIKSRGTR